MPSSKFSLPFANSSRQLFLLLFIFILIISAIIFLGISLASQYRQHSQQQLEQQFATPNTAVKSQVKRIEYQHVDEEGNIYYIEILITGHINIYDQNHRLIKSGIQGFSRINNFFDHLNRNLSNLSSSETGSRTLIIETNQGTIVIIINDDDINDLIDDIIDEIEDIADDTFSPTPTPIPPPPTLTPGGPTLTPTPLPTLPPTIAPTIKPFGPTPTPTPLPDYMTAPPFSCEEYEHLGRPVNISNIICGTD